MSAVLEECGACGRGFETLNEVFSHSCEPPETRRRPHLVGSVPSGPEPSGDGTGVGSKIAEEPATEKQLGFIRKLISEKFILEEQSAVLRTAQNLPKKGASKLIESLLAMPTVSQVAKTEPKAERREAVPDGLYLYEGVVIKVQRSKRGHAYATKLNAAERRFEYLGAGPLRTVTEEDALTLEAAAEFGHRYGVCAICARLLTNEESIERGIGPICAGRL